MNTKPGSKGPFTERLYLSTTRIEQLCEDTLRSVGLYRDVPSTTRIERIIEKKFDLTSRTVHSRLASWATRSSVLLVRPAWS